MTFAAAQNLAVALIVGACAAYAMWTLLPSAARRVLATAALRLPLPETLAGPLRRKAEQGAGGCGCDGCDRAGPKPASGALQRITVHRRPHR